MRTILILIFIGIIIAIIDIMPMIRQKINKFSIASAFAFHLILPFVLYCIDNELDKWMLGVILYPVMAIPVMILVAKENRKSVIIMLVSSIILGAIVGLAQEILL